jgi:DNA-binding NtrC family response regulator
MRQRSAEGPPPQLLCVDDDLAARKFYRRAFEAHGYKVLLAESGRTALQLLRKHRAHAIVSDYDMPGMNGAELAELVHRKRPRLPFVLISGKGEVIEDPPRGVHAAMHKGVPLEKVIEAVDHLLRDRKHRRPQLAGLRPLLPLGEALASIALAAFIVPRLLK